jgi:hypothetical protein
MSHDDQDVRPAELNFDPEALRGEYIRSVFGRDIHVSDIGIIRFEEIEVMLDSCILVFSVQPDIAELLVRAELDMTRSMAAEDSHNLTHHFGSRIGKMWFAKDANGYTDIIIFSFYEIEYSIALTSGASDVELSNALRAVGCSPPLGTAPSRHMR